MIKDQIYFLGFEILEKFKSFITSDDALSRFFFLLESDLDSCVKFDSSKLSSGGSCCEKALTLSEALLSEEDDLEGNSLACLHKNRRM